MIKSLGSTQDGLRTYAEPSRELARKVRVEGMMSCQARQTQSQRSSRTRSAKQFTHLSAPLSRTPPRSLAVPLQLRRGRPASALAAAHWPALAGTWPALAVVALTTLAFLAAAFVCLLILLRPLLKRLETLAVAAEAAAKSVEKASAEFELASNVLNTELPTCLDSVERASQEFEELGQSLNGITGGLKRSRPSAKQGGKSGGNSDARAAEKKSPSPSTPERSPVVLIQESTVNRMRKVAQDVSALTMALTPAMVAWRKRISFITERFEAAAKDNASSRPALPAVATVTANNAVPKASQNQSWIEEWRRAAVTETARQQSVGKAATDLAHAASKAAAVAKQSLPVDGEDSTSMQKGVALLDRAAEAAVSLSSDQAVSAVNGAPEAEGAAESTRAAAGNSAAIPTSTPTSGAGPATDLVERRQAAEAVFTALSKAEEAASAAASATGELESALQQAERQAGGNWWGWNPTGRSDSGKSAGGEPQEHDGMAYPSSPFIAATQSQDDDDSPPQPKTKKEKLKSGSQ